MKARVPLGGLIRDAQAMASRYEREAMNAVFSSLGDCTAYAVQEELDPSWGIYCDAQGRFHLLSLSDLNIPPGFVHVQQCPPLPPPPEPPKWAGYCNSCGGVLRAGQLACPECGWTGSGWED